MSVLFLQKMIAQLTLLRIQHFTAISNIICSTLGNTMGSLVRAIEIVSKVPFERNLIIQDKTAIYSTGPFSSILQPSAIFDDFQCAYEDKKLHDVKNMTLYIGQDGIVRSIHNLIILLTFQFRNAPVMRQDMKVYFHSVQSEERKRSSSRPLKAQLRL